MQLHNSANTPGSTASKKLFVTYAQSTDEVKQAQRPALQGLRRKWVRACRGARPGWTRIFTIRSAEHLLVRAAILVR